MLSKPATMLLGFIYEKPLNAYEIIKLLNYMNVKWWFNIADSTVYSTLKTLENLVTELSVCPFGCDNVFQLHAFKSRMFRPRDNIKCNCGIR